MSPAEGVAGSVAVIAEEEVSTKKPDPAVAVNPEVFAVVSQIIELVPLKEAPVKLIVSPTSPKFKVLPV
jgi:hypothetical protein